MTEGLFFIFFKQLFESSEGLFRLEWLVWEPGEVLFRPEWSVGGSQKRYCLD